MPIFRVSSKTVNKINPITLRPGFKKMTREEEIKGLKMIGGLYDKPHLVDWLNKKLVKYNLDPILSGGGFEYGVCLEWNFGPEKICILAFDLLKKKAGWLYYSTNQSLLNGPWVDFLTPKAWEKLLQQLDEIKN